MSEQGSGGGPTRKDGPVGRTKASGVNSTPRATPDRLTPGFIAKHRAWVEIYAPDLLDEDDDEEE